jgi:NAD-dependent SIR2 family protein deacetylase
MLSYLLQMFVIMTLFACQSQLERFGLPEPEAVFSISFFKKNPKPFHLLAKELFPGNYQPTVSGMFGISRRQRE